MRLSYHPLVQRDVNRILRRYDPISPRLGDEFWAELNRILHIVGTRPERFHFGIGELRRANLSRFPYHVLYRVKENSLRILVVRHNRRHPQHGLRRR